MNMNMKHSTKFIIQENRLEKLVSKYLNEFGLSKTSQMMGVSRSKVLELAKVPIDSLYAYEILYEKMRSNELKNIYEGFEIRTSLDGVFYWQAQTRTGRFLPDMLELISVAATPFWDGSDYTPVEIDWFTLFDSDMNIIIETEGGGDYFQQLKHQTHFKNVKELLNWYEEFYLPEVYNLVMNTLLPEVHQDIDDKLDERGSY